MKQVTLGQSTEGCFFDSYTLTNFLQATSVLSADLQKCFENSVHCFLFLLSVNLSQSLKCLTWFKKSSLNFGR